MQVLAQAREQGWKRLYIEGGSLIQAFLRDGFISDLTVTVIPILLGTGRPLFGRLTKDVSLRLVEAKPYPFGFLQLSYDVAQ